MQNIIRKSSSTLLIILFLFSGIFAVSATKTTDVASTGITTYNLDVGDTKYIFLDEGDKTIQSAAWTSNAPFDVEIISQDSVSCQVKVNRYISTTVIINCQYYYQQLNPMTNQIWLVKGAKSFYVKVNEETAPTTPTNPTTPSNPSTYPSESQVYNTGSAGKYTYSVNSNGTATITDYDAQIETSITIPSALGGFPVTSIGNNAFEYCKKLKKVTIPEGITKIGINTFYDCEGLEEIILPESLTEIDSGAFEYCISLKSIHIPKNVETISDHCFESCTGLEEITVDSNNSAYTGVDGVLLSKDMTSLKKYPANKSGTHYNIPQTVTILGIRSFEDNRNLESINIPDSVTSIRNYAFSYCKSLKEIDIPTSVTLIDFGAFSYCKTLTSFRFPLSATKLANNTFYHCTALKTITLPNTISSIGNDCFSGCTALESIYVPESITKVYTGAFDDCNKKLLTFYGYEGTYAQTYAKTNNLCFVSLSTLKDEANGICVENISDKNVTLSVSEITDTDSINNINATLKNESVLKAFNLSLQKNDGIYSPENSLVVKIPSDNTDSKIYLINDGTLTEVNTIFLDGYLVFYADILDVFVLTTPTYELGDTNTDGTVNIKDATLVQKHLAGILLLSDNGYAVADYNKDNVINIKDATAIQKFLAGII